MIKVYFKISVYVLFLDVVLAAMNPRFSQEKRYKGFGLISEALLSIIKKKLPSSTNVQQRNESLFMRQQ